ncbi:MAG: Druantia anti-phage system protein DruA [bacterium]|jgi:hypothetical protein
MVNREQLKHDLLNFTFLTQEEQKAKQPKKHDSIWINESIVDDPINIKPLLIPVDSTSKLWREWKSVEEHVSSFPFRRSPGRNNYFLVKNEYDGKNLGILDVAADFLALGPRDRHIGWNKDERVVRNRNIANISVCVPTRHFGYNMAGGKLLTLLAASNFVGDHWKLKYGDDLAGLTVTSLYGRGVQYNRLKHFKYLGLTQGQGTVQIDEDLYQQMRLVVEEEEGEIPGGQFTSGKNSRINIIRKASDYLNIDARVLTTHGNRRGIYWCDRGDNTSEFLRGIDKDFKVKEGLDIETLTNHWRERWAYKRIENVKTKV